MLKKLVKYGNSNALILDKAILELLNIEEGSTIKITTDGKSITLTPHVKATSEKVSETFTHDRAYLEAVIKESCKRYKGIPRAEEEKIANKLSSFIKRYQDLSMQLSQNPDFAKEVAQIAQRIDTASPEYVEAYKEMRGKYLPELIKIEKEMAAFESSIHGGISEKQQKAMEKEFAAHFKKHSNTMKLYGKLLNNPDYQHKAQLIAEKYNFDKNSSEYLKEIDKLTDSYYPAMGQCRKELKAISEKYSETKTK